MKRLLVLAMAAGMVIGMFAQNMKLAYRAVSDGGVDFEVYDHVDGYPGFVVVRCDGEVLGYSDQGYFDYEAMPDNFKGLLEGYKRAIAVARKEGVVEVAGSREQIAGSVEQVAGSRVKKAAARTVVIPPLLGENAWGQTKPFYNLCPTVSGEQSVVGCTALSTAQIMQFWKWPLVGKGSHTDNNMTPGLTVDFSQSNYEWSKMPYVVSESHTTAQAAAVARVCYDVGVSIDSYYGSGTGAYAGNVATALKTYFSYSATVKYQTKGSTLTSTWESKIKKELDEYRPVQFNGFLNAKGENGHAFVCDGYTSDGYFHFNFGWNGRADGYFKTTAVEPFTGEKFNYIQAITTGIKRPDNTIASVDGLKYYLMDNQEAELVHETNGTYEGEVVIPASITVDSVEYKVTRIATVAFHGCEELTAVTIPASVTYIGGFAFKDCPKLTSITSLRTTPIEICSAAFDADIYNRATLTVPTGKTSTYAAKNYWKLFRTISDGSTDVEKYSEWEDQGVGTYTFYGLPLLGTGVTVDNMPVRSRYLLTNKNKVQFLIEHGYNPAGLIVECDLSTGKCTIAKQYFGVSYGESTSGKIYVSDWPTISSAYTYAKYPCTYDASTGKLTMNLIYSVSAGAYQPNGADVFQFEPKDYSLTAANAVYATLSDGTGEVTVDVAAGNTVAGYKYRLYETPMPATAIAAATEEIEADETLETVDAEQLTLALSGEGVKTLVMVPYDKAGTAHDVQSAYLHWYDETGWESMGMCSFSDDALTTAINAKLGVKTYEVEVMVNKKNSGMLRLKNPYVGKYPYAKQGLTYDGDVYIDINAEHHDRVSIDYQFTGKDLQKKGWSFIRTTPGMYGQMVDGVITFPEGGIECDKYFTGEFVTSNASGATKIDMSALPLGIEDVASQQVAGSREQGAGSYNLAGQKVGEGYRGVVIIGGKKELRRR